jgi:hypothetical protein
MVENRLYLPLVIKFVEQDLTGAARVLEGMKAPDAIGAQSLAVVMRGIVMREIPAGKRLKLVYKEGRLGAINGAILGTVTATVA